MGPRVLFFITTGVLGGGVSDSGVARVRVVDFPHAHASPIYFMSTGCWMCASVGRYASNELSVCLSGLSV